MSESTAPGRLAHLRLRLSRTPWPGAALLASGIACIVLAASQTKEGRDDPAYWTAIGVAGIPLLLTGALLLQAAMDRRSLARNPTSRSRQIVELKATLDRAVTLVSAFRDEIDERDRLLRELEQRVESSRELLGMREAQVDAVVDELRAELRREGRRGLVRDVILGSVFFALGVGASILTH